MNLCMRMFFHDLDRFYLGRLLGYSRSSARRKLRRQQGVAVVAAAAEAEVVGVFMMIMKVLPPGLHQSALMMRMQDHHQRPNVKRAL